MSKSLYSNPIGSVVREITSNCFDSHKEAGVDDAVVISKGEDDEGVFISFKDVGVGLSPNRIKDVYMNYLTSTKRNTNDQIGGWGLGSKTPLAYTDYFYIETVFDKIKYNYILSMGETIPTLDLLNQEETEQRNGTVITIYIKKDVNGGTSTSDLVLFEKELKAQLCYFDNVYFLGWGIDNNYRIFEQDHFKYRSKDRYSEEMHIMLGKVSYPIDWKEIQIERIEIPIGIKFEIGELQVTPNREALRYTDDIKSLVKERIQSAYDEVIRIFHEQNKPLDNYFDWYAVRKSKPHIEFSYLQGEGQDLEIYKLYIPNNNDVAKKYKLSFVDDLDFFKQDDLLSKLYSHVGSFKDRIIPKEGRKRSRRSIDYDAISELSADISLINKIYISDKSQLTEAFAYTMFNGHVFRSVPVIRKYSNSHLDYKNVKRNNNRSFIKVSEDKIKDWERLKKNDRDRNLYDMSETDRGQSSFGNSYTYFDLGIGIRFYKALKTLREQVKERFYEYEELSEYQLKEFKDWKDKNNKNLQRKLEGKVLVKNIVTKYSSDSYEWRVADTGSRRTKNFVHGINSYTGIVVYGFRDDTIKLKEAACFMTQFRSESRSTNHVSRGFVGRGIDHDIAYPQAFRVIQISQQNEKYFKGKPNMIHVDDLYTDNKLFRKLASSMKIEDYLSSINIARETDVKIYIKSLKNISSEVGEKLEFLYNYYKITSNKDVAGVDIERVQIKRAILKVAKENNLFDPLVEDVFKQLDIWFKGIEWIKYIEISDNTIPIILETLRANKKKLNLDYYQKIRKEADVTSVRVFKNYKEEVLQCEIVFPEESEQPKFKVLTNAA